jgi:hypothetical protein
VDIRLPFLALQYHSVLQEVWNYYPVSFEEISASVSVFLKEEKKSDGKNDEES